MATTDRWPRPTAVDYRRLLLVLALAAVFLAGLAGGYVTWALLVDVESTSVTFRTGSVALAAGVIVARLKPPAGRRN